MWKTLSAEECLGQYYVHSEQLRKPQKCLWQMLLVYTPIPCVLWTLLMKM